MSGRLQGRIAIVTGAGCIGPGWGNGRATAVRFAEEEGLIVRSVLGDVLTLCPPLIISAAEIDELFDRLTRALDKTFDWVRRERLTET